MKSISIVHIEDEFEEFESLILFVENWLRDYWTDTNGELAIPKHKVFAKCSKEKPSWKGYEISCSEMKSSKVRYIFVRDKTLPQAVMEHLFDEVIFIVDVLRPMPKQTKLGITAHDSLKSIKKYIRDDIENVVLFTAHQGTGLETDDSEIPRKISKESESELEDYIGDALERCIDDG